MTENISPALLALIKNVKYDHFEDYAIDLTNNKAGEGFSGEVIFITLINKKCKEKQFIAVKQQTIQDIKPTEWSTIVFENEIHFYERIWPTLHKFYEETTGRSPNFIPKCLGTSLGGQKMIALEDLKVDSFGCHDKGETVDENHVNKVFKTYGVFHGISMSLKEQTEDEFFRVMKGVHNIWKHVFTGEDILGSGLAFTINEIQRYFDSDTEQHLIEMIQEFGRKGPNLIRNLLNNDSIHRVILHGDCWSNNFMFRYEENNQLQDIKLIDFQAIRSGSPAQDLTYYFYGAASVKDYNKLDHFLHLYHSSLSETLQEFGLNAEKIYPFSTFREEWKQFSKFGIAMSLIALKTKLADPKTIPDSLDITDGEKLKQPQLAEGKEEEYRLRIRGLVTHMHQNGFF